LRLHVLPPGKLPIEVLRPLLHSIRPASLVVPPEVGVDVGITRTNGKYLVSSSDPITGTSTRMGWHAVNVSANDIATSGIMPNTINVVSLFPEGTSAKDIKHLMDEINKASHALGIAVAGGHTEITPDLKKPIVTVTAFGSGNKFVTASDAEEGDSIIMTKTAGLEGTSILSRLTKVRKIVGPSVFRPGERLINQLSIVPEAKAAFATGRVNAMHDVTEGGVLGSVLEMSLASRLGFELNLHDIPVHNITSRLCSRLQLDPLKLIGSGTLLIACEPPDEKKILSELSLRRILATKIGKFVPKRESRWVFRDHRAEKITQESIEDELWRALSKYG
jgi:hydrogenase expression/formation protein HypE